MAKERTIHTLVQEKVDQAFEVLGEETEIKIGHIKSSEIDYVELIYELKRLISYTKEGKNFENFNSLFIFGPTGVGKSQICERIAEETGCVYHKLEIQKIPLEEFGGFPYLDDDSKGRKVTRLVFPTVLPPTDSEKVFLLHLDEFNKADTAKMAAVMNLVLTGEIGGAADYNEETGESEKYRLPQKTIIIGSGNFKTQDSVENLNMVNNMDISTSERFHRTVLLDYDARSWLESFATKEYMFFVNNGTKKSYKLSSRIPGILLHFISNKALTENNKAPFLIPISVRPDEGGSERTTSPRTWTLLADNMILDGIDLFEELPNEERMKYEKMSEEKYGNNSMTFDMFISNPSNQVDLVIKQAPELGLDGDNIIKEIVSQYVYFSQNRIAPSDIIFNYQKTEIRAKAKKLAKNTGAILNLIIRVANAISVMEEDAFDDIKISAVRISTLFEDLNVPSEDITAFIDIINSSKKESARKINNILSGISERYKNANSDYFYTTKDEIELGKEEEKEEQRAK